jgi:signal transduction histidine kinase
MAKPDDETTNVLEALIPAEVKALLAKRGLSLHLELRDRQAQPISLAGLPDLLAVLRELPERFAHSERLAAAGSLAAGVAHEARNLLTGAMGFAQVLSMKAHHPGAVQEMARLIEGETRRCVDILASFLKLSRSGVEAARICEASEIVSPVQRLVSQRLHQRNCRLVVSLAEDMPPVFGSCGDLQRVLINLILNAADATGSDGQIRLNGQRAADGNLELVVSDNGPGVPPALAERIFEPFFSTKTAINGTGLGLALSRDIVEAHGGRLDLDPNVDEGATFIVRLPSARPGTLVPKGAR